MACSIQHALASNVEALAQLFVDKREWYSLHMLHLHSSCTPGWRGARI